MWLTPAQPSLRRYLLLLFLLAETNEIAFLLNYYAGVFKSRFRVVSTTVYTYITTY